MVTAPILLFVKYAKRRENHQTTEAVEMRWSVKKVLLKISQISQENTCTRASLFINVAG